MPLTLRAPDDFHVHLRDGAEMAAVVPDTALRFARALVMPNLQPPIATAAQALAYRERIRAAVPRGTRFEPLMTLYLTAETTPEEVHRARASGLIHAVKYYPAGATTHSAHGVTDLRRVSRVLSALETYGMPLSVHGEVVDPEVDAFDRERVFIERLLSDLLERFPGLKIVLEHITTKHAVDFVLQGPERLAATITAHHLLMNRNALFDGGLRPHHYCLPLLKREEDRQALVQAARSGSPKFFLGTDSAPHGRSAKETPCGCAGIYTAHAAIELYAEAFEQAGGLPRLEAFASTFGAAFYDLPPNPDTITLAPTPWRVPASLPFGDGVVIPFRAGAECRWSLVHGR
ncbi:MAG: dihydroorotase [Gammaproteobacteria bacterium]